MQALVLEPDLELNLRDIEINETLGEKDVRIRLHTVGVCGSDVHYYEHGHIGPFVVKDSMVLGHEASGTVVEIGAKVQNLKVGDRVCMEPGISQTDSKESQIGRYNLDSQLTFWATPPVHGILRPQVIHPESYTFKLPENISFAEGAMVEPLAVGMHAATRAQIKPGDVGVVMGAGPIGMVTAMAALAGGCAQIIIADFVQEKLDKAATLGPITPVNLSKQSIREIVDKQTNNWGADIVFDCSGHPKAIRNSIQPLRPGGRVVFVGMPVNPVEIDIVEAQIKEATLITVLRYAHVYDRALKLMSAGKIDVKPLITHNFSFAKSKEAFDYALEHDPNNVKSQILMEEA